MRLRQVCLVAPEIGSATTEIRQLLGLGSARHDESGGGQRDVIPLGHDFLEVSAPGSGDTPGGRIVLQAEDGLMHRRRLVEMGVRTVYEEDRDPDLWITRYHPGDCGGVSLEIDSVAPEFDHLDPECPWPPAGDDWLDQVRTAVLGGVLAVTLCSEDPRRMGLLWSDLLDQPVFSHEGTSHIRLYNAGIRFEARHNGRGPGIESIDLAVSDLQRILEVAERLDRRTGERQVQAAGMRINLVDSVDL